MAKMKVIYSPEGGSKRTWEIDQSNPAWDLMYASEKATDWPWEDFTDRLSRGSAIALQALIWILRRRDEPRLQLDAVQPQMSEIDFEVECSECGLWTDDSSHSCEPSGDVEEGSDPEA